MRDKGRELLIEAQDITTPSSNASRLDERATLDDLLSRLNTTADISINAVSNLLDLNMSPNDVIRQASSSSVKASTTVDYEQFKHQLFIKSHKEIEQVVDTLKVDLQKAKVFYEYNNIRVYSHIYS